MGWIPGVERIGRVSGTGYGIWIKRTIVRYNQGMTATEIAGIGLRELDATALALIGHDVAMIPDASLGASTPCEGWTVADLVRHMNEQHEAITSTILSTSSEHSEDPRGSFARHAARWVVALEQAGDAIHVPKVGGPVPKHMVLQVHFVDMLVHRWDIARALGQPCLIPPGHAEYALPIARSITGPGSNLSGPGGVYQPPLDEDAALPPIDNIAALLGRSPRWRPDEPVPA